MTYTEGNETWEVSDCSSCNGKGYVWYPGCDDNTEPCSPCEGTGMISKKKDGEE